MTTTPPDAPSAPPPHDSGPRVTRDDIRDLGRLRRSVTNRKIAGVAGGLARHLDVDPLVLRVAFVVLVFFGGAGLVLYGACWLLVPEDDAARARINLDERSRSVALIAVGVLAALAVVSHTWQGFWFPWPIAIVALLLVWLFSRSSRSGSGQQPAGGAPGPATPYAPASTPPPNAPPSTTSTAPTYRATYDPSPYAAPAYGPHAYTPPAYAPPVRPPDPRKRGPRLFWFTLALIALCEGLLGLADIAGADVPGGAYAALAVAITGVMLVVGAFFGRAGGLILVGILATLAMVASTAADHWEGDRVHPTPTTAAGVQSDYRIGTGELVLDLRQVSDVDALDGRTVRLRGDIGRIAVILPDDLGATVDAEVNGPGSIELFGDEHGGINVSDNASEQPTSGSPEITIDAELGVGRIEVSHR